MFLLLSGKKRYLFKVSYIINYCDIMNGRNVFNDFVNGMAELIRGKELPSYWSDDLLAATATTNIIQTPTGLPGYGPVIYG